MQHMLTLKCSVLCGGGSTCTSLPDGAPEIDPREGVLRRVLRLDNSGASAIYGLDFNFCCWGVERLVSTCVGGANE